MKQDMKLSNDVEATSSSARYTNTVLGDYSLEITIPVEKDALDITFMFCTFSFFVFFLVSLLGKSGYTLENFWAILKSFFQNPVVTSVFWLILTLPLLIITPQLLWKIFGVEVIYISKDSILIRHLLLGFGTSKVYLAEKIGNLWVGAFVEHRKDFVGWVNGPRVRGSIRFEYEGKTVKFGAQLNEIEAKQMLSMIQEKYPQYRSKP